MSKCFKFDISKNFSLKIEVEQYLAEKNFCHIKLYNNNFPLSLNNYDLVEVYYKKNNKTFMFPCEVINKNQGIIGLTLTSEIANNYGEVEVEIFLKKQENIVKKTPTFKLMVKKAVYQGGNEKPTIDPVVEEIKTQVVKMEEVLGNNSDLQTQNKTNLVQAINETNEIAVNSISKNNYINNTEIEEIISSIFNI